MFPPNDFTSLKSAVYFGFCDAVGNRRENRRVHGLHDDRAVGQSITASAAAAELGKSIRSAVKQSEWFFRTNETLTAAMPRNMVPPGQAVVKAQRPAKRVSAPPVLALRENRWQTCSPRRDKLT